MIRMLLVVNRQSSSVEGRCSLRASVPKGVPEDDVISFGCSRGLLGPLFFPKSSFVSIILDILSFLPMSKFPVVNATPRFPPPSKSAANPAYHLTGFPFPNNLNISFCSSLSFSPSLLPCFSQSRSSLLIIS